MARPLNIGVQVTGLSELRRDLRRVDAALPLRLRELNRRVGEEIVLPAARARAAMSFPNEAGHLTHAGHLLAATLRVTSQQAAAQLVMGGAKFPYARGMEWGSSGKAGTRQFPARNGNRGGFILYPVIRERQEAIRAAYEAGLAELLREAGLTAA